MTSWADDAVLEAGFHKFSQYPIETKCTEQPRRIGALYTGAADSAILGEEIHAPAAAAFQRVLHYPPLKSKSLRKSDVRNFDYAHVFRSS